MFDTESIIKIKKCRQDSDFKSAIQITKHYIVLLNIDLSFQNIDKELASFNSIYGPPKGLFLLALYDGQLAGGAGLRMLESTICEMKRLFVYNEFTNMGIGRRLCNALIREAKNLGYDKMRLDTLARMEPAIGLYESLGFVEIQPYRFNPDPTAKYMELSLF